MANATLYRHFLTREALVLEVYRHEVRQLADAADQLIAETDSAEALERWIERLGQYAVNKRGLAAALQTADRDGMPLFADVYQPIVDALRRLLVNAEADGVVRAGLDPDEVILAFAGLWQIDPETDWRARGRSLFRLVFTGLRAR